MRNLLLLAICAFVFAIPAKAQKSSMDYASEGSRYYLNRDFKKAIGPYQKAVDLEKKDRKLDKNLWRAVVDNLGMAYGITGDIKNSQEVLAYGIKEDPTYPMFHYNMACGYGELGKEDEAIAELRLAFQYEDNMIEGERMPDPMTDSSFAKFRNNKKFREAVVEMKSGS